MNAADAHYRPEGDLLVPRFPVSHRSEEYDPAGFEILRRMQSEHFWYRGRSRFLLHALTANWKHLPAALQPPRAIDLGGGAGGWAATLSTQEQLPFAEIALADSSVGGLRAAAAVVPPAVRRYQVDLLRLEWEQRWDLVFLLDVLEHIPDDAAALSEVYRALPPGGLVVVTVPALQRLWSTNDALVGHQRRYSRGEMLALAERCGFRTLESRYFMFLLSPLLILSRLLERRAPGSFTSDERRTLLSRTHRVPSAPLNQLLRFIFELETPLSRRVHFPWGTSLLAILQKP